MANITTIFSNDFLNSSVRDTVPQTTFGVNQATLGFFENVWQVGLVEDTLTPSNISTTGYAFFRNVSSANFVEIGMATGEYFATLKAGEFAWMRLNPAVTTLYAVADTAPVNLQVKVFND